MPQAIETIDVDVPVSVAYNQWTQFEEFPKFLDEVESITQPTDTLTVWKVKVGPVEREFEANITEQHPDERVAWNSTGGEVDHAGRRHVPQAERHRRRASPCRSTGSRPACSRSWARRSASTTTPSKKT